MLSAFLADSMLVRFHRLLALQYSLIMSHNDSLNMSMYFFGKLFPIIISSSSCSGRRGRVGLLWKIVPTTFPILQKSWLTMWRGASVGI